LGELGKAHAIVDEVEAVALHPAMVAACAPRAVGVKMTEGLRDASGLAIRLMPHRALGFEQTFVCREVLRGQARIEGFGILAKQGDAIVQNVVEGFLAP
jgi:hypothetical protein